MKKLLISLVFAVVFGMTAMAESVNISSSVWVYDPASGGIVLDIRTDISERDAASGRLEVLDADNRVVRVIDFKTLPERIEWDGCDRGGKKLTGKAVYSFRIVVNYDGKELVSNKILISAIGGKGDTRYREDDAGYAFLDKSKVRRERELTVKDEAEFYGMACEEADIDYEPTKEIHSRSAGPASTIMGGGRRNQSSGLRAGYADDNRQYNYFIDFLSKYNSSARHIDIDVSERIVLTLRDQNGLSLPGAQISVYTGKKLISQGRTYADGRYMFFPSEYDEKDSGYRVTVSAAGRERELVLDRQGQRSHVLDMDISRSVQKGFPVDIVFILDTTGSMSEEISRLKRTLEIIQLNLMQSAADTDLRFGFVFYRDRGDSYIARMMPLSSDVDKLLKDLSGVRAGGGGDYPEDLQSALKLMTKEMNWRKDGVKLAYVITDAPPHLDYNDQYDYFAAARDAKREGIKVHSIGTGGLDINGEYVLRQLAQYTCGRYIFLNYGERGESDGGTVGAVSHHTGENYSVESLESIVINFSREEINNWAGEKMLARDEYFSAKPISGEEPKVSLEKLFDRACKQLVNYASVRIKSNSTIAVAPMVNAKNEKTADTEYFTSHLTMSVKKNTSFKLVERNDIAKILSELAIDESGLTVEKDRKRIGGLLGADYLVLGKLYGGKDGFECIIRLVRVESGEVLSLTKAKLDAGFALAGLN